MTVVFIVDVYVFDSYISRWGFEVIGLWGSIYAFISHGRIRDLKKGVRQVFSNFWHIFGQTRGL